MAVKELEIKITWENNNFFLMEQKSEGGQWKTVVRVTENTFMKSIRGHLQGLCITDFTQHLAEILNEMEA